MPGRALVLLLAIAPIAANAADPAPLVVGVQRGDVAVVSTPLPPVHPPAGGPGVMLYHRNDGYTLRDWRTGSYFYDFQSMAVGPPVADTPRGLVGQVRDPIAGGSGLLVVGASGQYAQFTAQPLPWIVRATAAAPIGSGLVVAFETYAPPSTAKDRTELWRFDAAGNVVDTMLLLLGNPVVTEMDIAADRCTLFYLNNGIVSGAISRYDICRHEALPDFAQRLVRSFRILPDGGLLAVDDTHILRFDAKGRLLSSTPSPLAAPTYFRFAAVALDADPSVAWIMTTGSFVFYMAPMKIETGELVGDLFFGSNAGNAVVVAGEWRAAVHALPPRQRAVR